MNEQFFNKRIAELSELPTDTDLARATRRLLDLGAEMYLNRTLENKILELRKKYTKAADIAELSHIQIESFRNEMAEICSEVKQKADFTKHSTLENKVMLVTKNLEKIYERKGKSFVFASLDLELKIGEITGVVGENGNGKTTLLRMLAGDLANTDGSITFPQYHTSDWYEIKKRIGYIPQRIDPWYGTLLDNLKFTAAIHGIINKENDYAVDYIIERLGLGKYKDLTWKQISGGYRLRFELAKVLIRKPDLLILDEPLANLDINAQQLFLQDLKYLSQSLRYPFAVILSSQQLHEVENISDNILFIKNGTTLYNGSRRDFGKDRQQNCIEINGQFLKDELLKALSHIKELTIEETGTIYIINFPREIDSLSILKHLIDSQLKVNYYRDISDSTRKLFKKDM